MESGSGRPRAKNRYEYTGPKPEKGGIGNRYDVCRNADFDTGSGKKGENLMNMSEQACDYFAVNIADMTAHIEPGKISFVGTLLQPVLTDERVECERKSRWDGISLRIRRDIPLSRWMAILDILRNGVGSQKPTRKNSLRIYQSKTGKGSWKRI